MEALTSQLSGPQKWRERQPVHQASGVLPWIRAHGLIHKLFPSSSSSNFTAFMLWITVLLHDRNYERDLTVHPVHVRLLYCGPKGCKELDMAEAI